MKLFPVNWGKNKGHPGGPASKICYLLLFLSSLNFKCHPNVLGFPYTSNSLRKHSHIRCFLGIFDLSTLIFSEKHAKI